MWLYVAGVSKPLKEYIEKNNLYGRGADEIIDQIPSNEFKDDFVIEELDIGLEAVSEIYDPIKISTKYIETFELDQSQLKSLSEKYSFGKINEQSLKESGFSHFIIFVSEGMKSSVTGELLLEEVLTKQSLKSKLKILQTTAGNSFALKYKSKTSNFLLGEIDGGYDDMQILNLKQAISILSY